jgi:hypothetical protein
MSHLSIEPTPSSRLLVAARLACVLGLSLALWLGLSWGLATASRLPGSTNGVVDSADEPPYDFALQGSCDITVTNAADSGAGSLRQAIADACDGGRITFAGNYTIYLNSTLEITRRLTIDGEAHTVTVSGDSGGDGTANVQVFSIASSAVATLTHLNIVSGMTSGNGGGIRNSGTLMVWNSTLSGDSTANLGGGIYNGGALTVTNSTLAGNSSTWDGGGIYNDGGTVTVHNSTISGNSVGNVAGGIYNEKGTLTVQNSTLSGNSAYAGGGIYDDKGTLTVQNSTLSGNSASNATGGGGISAEESTVTVQNSTLSGNSAGKGGGISGYHSTVTVTNSTLSGNLANTWHGGGMDCYGGTVTVQNSTLSGNSAYYQGGGIYNSHDAELTVRNSTLSANSAPDGGGIYNSSSVLHLYNTLIANSPSGGDCVGSVTTNDHNLIADGSCSPAISGDPHLGPLANYGGSTSAYALLPGSPAIDAGNDCLDTDQRGIARPQGAACDIGAFESEGFSLTLTRGNNQSTLINTAFAQPLSVTLHSMYGEPVGPGGVVTFTAPGSGASLAPAVLTATTNAGGVAGVTAMANSLAGGYVVTATAQGAGTPVVFNLTNTALPAPAMAVLGNGQAIPDGDTTPSAADGTDFGSLVVGQAITHTFTISNGGVLALNLTGSPAVSIAGPAALDFSLVASPSLTVAPNATTTFQVRFVPSVAGTRVATASIANNDPANNPYDFAIQGAACNNAITVINAGDSGPGSLRQAIADACPGGRITFDNNYTIHLTTTLSIDKRLTIDGEAHAVDVSGDSGGDGTPDVTVFTITSSSAVTLTHLSIVNGKGIPSGGGIYNQGTLAVQDSALSGNTAGILGGAIYNAGTLTVTNSTLFSNSAGALGGGGISNFGIVIVQNSILSNNSSGSAGGGMYNGGGTLIVQNTTLSGNSAVYYGGGIYNNVGTLTVQNGTLSGNSAGWIGGGIDNDGGTLHLYNTLIANSLSSGDCRGSVATNNYNLMTSTGSDACGLANGTGGSLIGVNPLLGPLGDYGGATSTIPLLPGSPAIDAGAACLSADQRGATRPQGAACDIGAFESEGFSLALAGGDNQSTLINTAFANPLSVTVSSAYGEPVGPGGVITFAAPAAGASLNPAVRTATTSASGAASVTATANGLVGSYAVTATATGVLTPVTFHLTNTTAVPAMAVLGNGQVILDGNGTPTTADGTDFGSAALGQAVTHTFTISNDGTADLTLTGAPLVSIGGPAALDFSLVASPTITVTSGAATTFRVRFTPSLTGTRVATLTIANDDPARNPYDFAVQGQGTASSEQHTFLPVILRLAQ